MLGTIKYCCNANYYKEPCCTFSTTAGLNVRQHACTVSC